MKVLVSKRLHLTAHNLGTRVKREDIPNEGLLLSLPDHHVGDLDDGVLLRLGEDPLPAGTLDVEGEDPEGRHVGPLALHTEWVEQHQGQSDKMTISFKL